MEGEGRWQNETSWSGSISILLKNLIFYLFSLRFAVSSKACNPLSILESQVRTGIMQFSKWELCIYRNILLS